MSAALGDIAESDTFRLLELLKSVFSIEWVHLQSGHVNQKTDDLPYLDCRAACATPCRIRNKRDSSINTCVRYSSSLSFPLGASRTVYG